MCFAPQPRPDCDKSAPSLRWFLTVWLGNLLCARGACNFPPLIPPDGPAPAALASLLAHPEPQNTGKKQMFRDCSTFPCSSIFFLLTPLIWVFSFPASPRSCCCICPQVWSLIFKLPSMMGMLGALKIKESMPMSGIEANNGESPQSRKSHPVSPPQSCGHGSLDGWGGGLTGWVTSQLFQGHAHTHTHLHCHCRICNDNFWLIFFMDLTFLQTHYDKHASQIRQSRGTGLVAASCCPCWALRGFATVTQRLPCWCLFLNSFWWVQSPVVYFDLPG